MTRSRGWEARRRLRDDSGSALVEFVALSLLLLVPITYLVVAMARIQAGIFAAEEASAAAARATVVEGVASKEGGASAEAAMAAGAGAAEDAVELTAEDFGVEGEPVLALGCDAACLDPGSNVTATVSLTVTLPGIPDVLAGALPLEVEVSATSRAPVDSVVKDS